jgi:hypothetical protein
VSNYGALAVLALTMKRRRKVPSPDEADLRWLIVLETFPADAKGWRQVGAQLLAEEAGLAYSTSRQARDRLVAAGVVEYRPGNGRGNRSSYRFAAPLKVPTLERHLAETGEADLGDLDKGADLVSAPFTEKGAGPGPAPSRPDKGAETPPEKVPRHAEKGAGRNPLTSGNENAALEAFALEPSALPPRPNALRERLAAVVPDVTERETAMVLELIGRRPRVDSPAAVMLHEIGLGLGPSLVAEVRGRGMPPPDSADRRPSSIPFGARCPRCSSPDHALPQCPERDPAPDTAPAPPGATEPAEPCLAGERCQRHPVPVDKRTGYHPRCGAAAMARASMAARPAAPLSGVNLAAEQAAASRSAREAGSARSEAAAS